MGRRPELLLTDSTVAVLDAHSYTPRPGRVGSEFFDADYFAINQI
jgi:hypothetical protein